MLNVSYLYVLDYILHGKYSNFPFHSPLCKGFVAADQASAVEVICLDVFLQHGYAAVSGHRADVGSGSGQRA
jgi:hypothetical protein